MVLPAENLEKGVMSKSRKIGVFRFSWDLPAMRHDRQVGHYDGH